MPVAVERSLQILIVAADPLVRTALARTLEVENGLSVVGRAGTGPELAEEIARIGPDVVLLDAGLQPPSGLERPGAPDIPVVWLIADPDGTRGALQAGARGVLRRDAEAAFLAAALRAATRGLLVLDPAFVTAGLGELPHTISLGSELTARERQVLEQLARGRSNKEIASTLEISEHTAKFHVNSLLSKLGAQSRTEVVVRAARRGWLTL